MTILFYYEDLSNHNYNCVFFRRDVTFVWLDCYLTEIVSLLTLDAMVSDACCEGMRRKNDGKTIFIVPYLASSLH